MKLLNTIQELWDYCLYCPICQERCREMHVSVGPDETFRLISFKKGDKNLHLKCQLLLRKLRYFVEYNINCEDNSFTTRFSSPEDTNNLVDKASSPYFYFYIQSSCKKCNYSYCNGSDLEIDLQNQKVVSIGIERDGIYFIEPSDKYHVTLNYNTKQTMISNCAVLRRKEVIDSDKDNSDDANIKIVEEIVDIGKCFVCPIIKVDMRDSTRAIRKIKTLLTFS